MSRYVYHSKQDAKSDPKPQAMPQELEDNSIKVKNVSKIGLKSSSSTLNVKHTLNLWEYMIGVAQDNKQADAIFKVKDP